MAEGIAPTGYATACLSRSLKAGLLIFNKLLYVQWLPKNKFYGAKITDS